MDEQKTTTEGRGFGGRRGILYGVLGLSAVAAAFVAKPLAAAGAFHGFGGRWGHHRMSPEAMHEHLQVGVKWALRDVDATEEQQARVSAIVGAALTDLHRLKEAHVANRDAFRTEIAAASVDREALERIRKAELALAEDASRRLVAALADAAEVLTPEQRKALAERHERHARR
jgi:Spy/CpxP family protein refolding chaperone